MLEWIDYYIEIVTKFTYTDHKYRQKDFKFYQSDAFSNGDIYAISTFRLGGELTEKPRQADWTDLWQKALRSSYKPIVNVEAVRANKSKGKSSLLASAQETAKYQVKSADYMTDDDNRNQQVIDDLEQALAGTRQIGYGGLLKRIKRQLKLDDADNGDLVNVDGEELPEPTEAELIVAKWDQQRKNYLIW